MRADVLFAGIAVGGVLGALILSAVLDRRDARIAAAHNAARATTAQGARRLPIRHIAAGVACDSSDHPAEGDETQPAQRGVVVATETVEAAEELPPNAPGTFCPHCFYLTKAAWPTIEPAWHLQPRMCEQHLKGHELVGGGERHKRRTQVTVLVHRFRVLRPDPRREPRCIWN